MASRWTRKIANVLLIVLVLTVFLLAFVPWQQNVAGSGSVLAFAPDQRQQVIEAPIKGRVVRWGENIVENALVQKGQFIAEISDLDESYSARLEQQLVNSQLTADAAGRQLDANERALTAAKTIVNSYEAQVRAYEKVKEETIAAQDAYVDMAREKVRDELDLDSGAEDGVHLGREGLHQRRFGALARCAVLAPIPRGKIRGHDCRNHACSIALRRAKMHGFAEPQKI